MAIVRMVNGISDKAQKGKTAVSVSSNAAAAGKLVATSPQGSNSCITLITTHHLFLTVALDPAYVNAPLTSTSVDLTCTHFAVQYTHTYQASCCLQTAVAGRSMTQPSCSLWGSCCRLAAAASGCEA